MKLSCLQENLSRGLGIVGRAVATRTTLPITNNVLLATDGGRLKLSATNLEIAITCWIGAKVEEEGTTTVPARLLTDLVSSLPNERMDLSQPLRSHTIHLACGRNEAKITGQAAADFPPIPTIGEGVAIPVGGDALHTAIDQVAFAAATDESRPVLTGVQASFEGSTVTLAAADGFRLSVHKLALDQPVAEKVAVIIPARSLQELNRLLDGQEEPVQVTVNAARSQALFKLKNAEMVSQLVQGTFPNYGQLIPQSSQSRAVVNRAEFLRATKAAAIFARDGSGIIRLQVTPAGELGPGKLAVSARAEELGENLGELDAAVTGEAGKIAFNAKYLTEVLSVLDSEQVALETTSPTSPGVIRPVGVDNFVHVVMPMFVQW
ncbi:MAG: DNA polymerase III subunit beta [Chloroflexi bacterium]|nr:DNA polymerase III subunit beta [Chloroflexota bacterium]